MRDNWGPMGYWGWRRLLAVFISVWVVGCTTTHEAAPTLPPTKLPKVTLTAVIPISPTPQSTPESSLIAPPSLTSTPVIYTVQPGDALLQIALRFGVDLSALRAANAGIEPLSLQIGQQLTIPNPSFDAEGMPALPTFTPPALTLTPPTCYSIPTDHILCLGQVANPLSSAMERVTVLVRLIAPDGDFLAEGQASIEQLIIPPGGFAPYRFLFNADWRDYGGSAAFLQSADVIPSAAERFVALDVLDQQHSLADGQYAITAVLHNSDVTAAQLYRVVITLSDSQGQITGYRIVQFDRLLNADERFPLELLVMPEIPNVTTQYRLYVEAVRATATPG